MAYPNEEKETSCTFDYVTKKWTVYTCVPRHITKLIKACGEPIWKEEEEDKHGQPRIIAGKWVLASNQVRFYSPFVGKSDDTSDDTDESEAEGEAVPEALA